MSFGQRLSRLLLERGLNQSDLARAVGVKSQAVNQWVKNKTEPRGKRARRLAESLGITLSELMGESDAAAPSSRPERHKSRGAYTIRELDVRPQGGYGAEMPEMDGNGHHLIVAEWQIPADYLRAFTPSPQAVRIVRVAGDSMEPDYPSGDRVLVDTSHVLPSPPGVYVLWDGYGLVLKRLEVIHGSDPPVIRLSSSNPAYPPYERPASDVRISGRVIGKWVWK